jgi:hypothetical protein
MDLSLSRLERAPSESLSDLGARKKRLTVT